LESFPSELRQPTQYRKKVWQNLSSNFIPKEKMTMYRVLNDVIPNNVKLKEHRIRSRQSQTCLECHVLDTNAHSSKRCEFSLLSREWLKQRFIRNLNLDVDDPEEILTRCSERNGKAGLWLLLGVVHYNMKNYKAGSITEMIDGFRKIRWQRKEEVEKIFGNALYTKKKCISQLYMKKKQRWSAIQIGIEKNLTSHFKIVRIQT
jgi:hypothetical protein